jgi:predicted nucleotidyltransferase
MGTLVERIRERLPETQAIWLFGSLVAGTHRPDSDIDLAVLLPPGRRPDAFDLFQLRRELAELAGREVDLVPLREAAVAFSNEIVSSGARIWEGSAKAAAEFEMHTLSLWQKLNEERAGILEDVLATGRVLDRG